MSTTNPLQRAHILSAQASTLINPNSTLPHLTKALEKYNEAHQLFQQALEKNGTDESMRKTLEILIAQHKRLIRDLERRIAGMKRNDGGVSAAGSVGSSTGRVVVGASGGVGRVGLGSPRHEGMSLGLAGMGGMSGWNPTGLASALSPSIGLPPFALRPQPTIPPSIPSLPQAPNAPHSLPSTETILSPLVSSSSSDESYLNLGGIPDTIDPFSRFWGMLENMLEEVSNPVVFASAPLDTTSPVSVGGVQLERKDLTRSKSKGKDRTSSPSESFYVVPKKPSNQAEETRNPSPSAKTPEELALENTSLRASLDALAIHSHDLELQNRVLQQSAEEKEKIMRSMVVGVRLEAQKAKHGQDLMRSQLLVGNSPRALGRMDGTGSIGEPSTAHLRNRIRELEGDVVNLKAENEKQKGQIDKYRDRFEKLKINARAKREVKLNPGSAKDNREELLDDG